MTPPSVTLLRTQSDERLVALARGGHERAFEAIVERYRKPLLRHSRRLLPEARAEDALQQALVSAWTALRRGDEVRELRPWLYRIVHNTSLNALRVNGYDYAELRETLEGVGGPAELAERRALVRHTFAGLAALPERQREALLAIAVEGRSQEEVAEELGLTPGGVRQLVHRARTTLRAAATAVTPMPLVHWLAAAERVEPLSSRMSELVAGGTTAGLSATLAKAGAVAVIAGGAVSAPTVVHKIQDSAPPARVAAAAAATPRAGEDGTREQGAGAATAAPAASASPSSTPAARRAAGAGRHHKAASPSRRRGRTGTAKTVAAAVTVGSTIASGSASASTSSGISGSGSSGGSGSDDNGGRHTGTDDSSGSGRHSGGGDDNGGSGSGSSGRHSGTDDSSGSGRSGGGEDSSGSSSGRRSGGSGSGRRSGDDSGGGSSHGGSSHGGSSHGGSSHGGSSGGSSHGGSSHGGSSGGGQSSGGDDGAKVDDSSGAVEAPKVEDAPKIEDEPKVEDAPKVEDSSSGDDSHGGGDSGGSDDRSVETSAVVAATVTPTPGDDASGHGD